jgi:hypothetical protein
MMSMSLLISLLREMDLNDILHVMQKNIFVS